MRQEIYNPYKLDCAKLGRDGNWVTHIAMMVVCLPLAGMDVLLYLATISPFIFMLYSTLFGDGWQGIMKGRPLKERLLLGLQWK